MGETVLSWSARSRMFPFMEQPWGKELTTKCCRRWPGGARPSPGPVRADQRPAAGDGAHGIGGQGRPERGGIPPLPREPTEPQPAQGHCLGEAVLQVVATPEMAEVD